MPEKKSCQMYTTDGTVECGNMVGARCKADPNHPFVVTGEINRALRIVGCTSWSRYLNYGRNDTVPELPVNKVGTGGNIPTGKESIATPVPVQKLQESNTAAGRNTKTEGHNGGNMTEICAVCGKQSVVRESNGNHYCYDHHDMFCTCITHEKMVKFHEQGIDNVADIKRKRDEVPRV
jgi:hypothetical protein